MSLKRSAEVLDTAGSNSEAVRVSSMKVLDRESVLTPKKLDYEDHSLTSIMSARRSSLQAMHKKFAHELEQRRKVCFDSSCQEEPIEEPPQKRRRFERRNSKTAAMLFSSMASIVASDFADSDKEEASSDSRVSDEGAWDGGLEIAEELVRQLKLRRKGCGNRQG